MRREAEELISMVLARVNSSGEDTNETLALLELLALAERQVEEGAVSPAAVVFGRLRRRLARR